MTIFFRQITRLFCARRRIRIGAFFLFFTAISWGCAGRGATPESVAQAYAKACQKGDGNAARRQLAPEIADTSCPDETVTDNMRAADGRDFGYDARLGRARLTRHDGAPYRLRPDILTDIQTPEHAILKLTDDIRRGDADEIYKLFSKSLTGHVSVDKLRNSLTERPNAWNAIYAALAAQPIFEIQIGGSSARCYAPGTSVDLIVEDGYWKIAAIDGLF